MNRNSKRFLPNTWTERVVPALMVIVLIGLLLTIAIVLMAVIGITPGIL